MKMKRELKNYERWVLDSRDDNDLVRAQALLEGALVHNASNSELRVFYAYVLTLRHLDQEALDEALLLYDRWDYSALGFMVLAWTFWELGKAQKAREIFERAISCHPDEDDLYIEFAEFALCELEPIEALGIAEVLIRRVPDDPESFLMYGQALFLMNRYDDAELAYRDALKLDPQHVEARFFLLERLIDKGDMSQAIGLARLMLDDQRTAERALRYLKESL